MDAAPPPPASTVPAEALALRRLAHELRSQLGVVVTAVTLQQEQIEALAAALVAHPAGAQQLADLRETTALAGECLQRALQLVKRVLQGGAVAVTAQPLALLAAQAVALTQQAQPQLDLQLAVALPADWAGDALAWHQIFVNLVGNSIRHGFAGRARGTIRIEGSEMVDGLRRIDYHDDGAGIPPDLLPRLFQDGYTTRAERDGHGLGLGIVFQLLEQNLHGSIECLPDAGGAHFRIEFSALPQAAH